MSYLRMLYIDFEESKICFKSIVRVIFTDASQLAAYFLKARKELYDRNDRRFVSWLADASSVTYAIILRAYCFDNSILFNYFSNISETYI